MLWSNVNDPWWVAFPDCLLTGILFILALIAVIVVVMEVMFVLSGYDGEHPTVLFCREAKRFWKEPYV